MTGTAKAPAARSTSTGRSRSGARYRRVGSRLLSGDVCVPRVPAAPCTYPYEARPYQSLDIDVSQA